MPRRIQRYATGDIEVTFEPAICIHAARCLQGLPEIFDVGMRPWVMPENATADEVAEVIERCPSGALKYRRLDGGAQETPDERSSIRTARNGPLYVRGDIEIQDSAGNEIRRVTRATLCRCGGSRNKPFCDGTHRTNGFTAD